jgi:hypothetical protein
MVVENASHRDTAAESPQRESTQNLESTAGADEDMRSLTGCKQVCDMKMCDGSWERVEEVKSGPVRDSENEDRTSESEGADSESGRRRRDVESLEGLESAVMRKCRFFLRRYCSSFVCCCCCYLCGLEIWRAR